jgi:L-threonylcarbamoyladenylate synthase
MVLIKQAGVPLAAPSANASTKPSPTAAEHVLDDLNGRIDMILDGGPCNVGVESTVVDGLSCPPAILRPGGISIEQLRSCPGWEKVVIGYQDQAQLGPTPRAPGMKYRHYSPKAKVILFEANSRKPRLDSLADEFGMDRTIAFINTKAWRSLTQLPVEMSQPNQAYDNQTADIVGTPEQDPIVRFRALLQSSQFQRRKEPQSSQVKFPTWSDYIRIWEISLGSDNEDIARGLFWALRELDKRGVDVILVEGIDEHEGVTAAAIMNRLRKAAEVNVRA